MKSLSISLACIILLLLVGCVTFNQEMLMTSGIEFSPKLESLVSEINIDNVLECKTIVPVEKYVSIFNEELYSIIDSSTVSFGTIEILFNDITSNYSFGVIDFDVIIKDIKGCTVYSNNYHDEFDFLNFISIKNQRVNSVLNHYIVLIENFKYDLSQNYDRIELALKTGKEEFFKGR